MHSKGNDMTLKEALIFFELLEIYNTLQTKEERQQAIKKKYRNLMKKWHPDVCQETDTLKVKQMLEKIDKAYTLLMQNADQTIDKQYTHTEDVFEVVAF